MKDTFYTEWSSHVPVAVVNDRTYDRFWFDKLDEEHKDEALDLPVFDLTLRRFVQDGGRRHAFIMHRKHIRF